MSHGAVVLAWVAILGALCLFGTLLSGSRDVLLGVTA